ncbi:hypothetical protein [Streptomyces bugieae]|uniref:Uncharacterized protein n=1 Tax=Streptomyces bugieae TaxID=3098223 RepID=A0ABU7NL70_9ACTN|nr:hypothetical protein [Streptomyces sp. DSM 41528]
MSYDIHLEVAVDTGGPEPHLICPADIGNMTANVSGMWHDALGYPLAKLDGRTAGNAAPDLRRAVTDMELHPAIYRAMEPDNGWGSYDGALDYLRRLADACAQHPKATIRISH